MSTPRNRDRAALKARVALEARKGPQTVNEFAGRYGVPPTQMTHGKPRRQQEVPAMFSARRPKQEHDHEALQAQVYQQIGPLKVEWDWVKKHAGRTTSCPAADDRAR